MRKWFKRILIALGGLVLVLGCATFFGGRQAAEKYLAQDRMIGSGRLRLVEPKLRWSLDLSVDSILFDSPNLKLAVGKTHLAINIFKSIIHVAPTVQLKTDTLTLDILPTEDTAKQKLDSLPFPDIKLPANIIVKAKRIRVSDSDGVLATGDGLLLESRDPESLRFSFSSINARPMGNMRVALRASLNWQNQTQIMGSVMVQYKSDSLNSQLNLEKKNLLLGKLNMQARLRSSLPYIGPLNLPTAMPIVEFLRGDIGVETQGNFKVTLAAQARLSGFSDSGSLRLNSQQTVLNLGWSDSIGLWSLRSHGITNKNSDSAKLVADTSLEDVQLSGKLFLSEKDSLKSPTYLIRHLGMTAQGYLRGVDVIASGKRLPADLNISESVFSQDIIQAALLTGDGSRINIDLKQPGLVGRRDSEKSKSMHNKNAISKVNPTSKSNILANKKPKLKAKQMGLAEWQGNFSVDLVQDERWVTAFTDTQLVFKSFHIQGKAKAGQITAMSEAYGLKAYGTLADSVRLYHEYGPKGYRIQPSPWSLNGVTWTVTGKIDKAKRMSLRFENSVSGSLQASMPNMNFLEVHAQALELEKIPYRGMSLLSANHPKVSGVFIWDFKADTGHTDLNLAGNFKGQAIKGQAVTQWSREFLEVRSLKAEFAGSEINASAKLRMHGRPFYSLGKATVPDLVSVAIQSERFDLAKALSVVLPSPPLKSASLLGDFSYQDSLGFQGQFQFKNVEFQKLATPVSVKELALIGKGDTLIVKAITVSDQEPLLNDSIHLSLSGAMGKIQTLALNMHSPSGLRVAFHGLMHAYQDLEGKLSIDGKLTLPNKQGEILNLAVRAQGSLPFKQGLKGLRLDADTLRGAYAVAGIDTQSFSATVQTRDFRITLPDLVVKSKGGKWQGRMDYAVMTRRMSATLNGQSLAAQLGLGDKFQIRDFRIDAQADSNAFNVQAAIGSASFEHVKAPMRVAGDLSRISLVYRKPLGEVRSKQTGNNQIPYLRVSAVLDSSALRYRLRTLESLQGLFKKSSTRRQVAHRTKPMQVQINIETAGSGNIIETDILRLAYVGNVSMVGVYPFALMQGRLTAREGSLGTKKQAYRIRRFEVKWLNSPIEEGRLEMDSEKKLARSCEANVTDSCSVIMRLDGALNNMQFSYDSDCQGSYGAGVQVSALVYSVRRGCYSSAFSSGGGGLTYQEQALTLLETPLSGYLSEAAEKLSGKWIASAQVTGLGALAQSRDQKSRDSGSTASSEGSGRDAIALEILSKEFWRLRLRARSAYKPDIAEEVNPWAYLVGLEWRPPLFRFIDNPAWKHRVKNNVSMAVSLFTDPDRTQSGGKEDILKRLGLNYNYDFWGYWWSKPASEDSLRGKPRRKVTTEDAIP
jgi:hypothetical protein